MKGRRARRLRPARALPWASAQEDTIPLILGAEEAETTLRPAPPSGNGSGWSCWHWWSSCAC
jgi:hypothetical protein